MSISDLPSRSSECPGAALDDSRWMKTKSRAKQTTKKANVASHSSQDDLHLTNLDRYPRQGTRTSTPTTNKSLIAQQQARNKRMNEEQNPPQSNPSKLLASSALNANVSLLSLLPSTSACTPKGSTTLLLVETVLRVAEWRSLLSSISSSSSCAVLPLLAPSGPENSSSSSGYDRLSRVAPEAVVMILPRSLPPASPLGNPSWKGI